LQTAILPPLVPWDGARRALIVLKRAKAERIIKSHQLSDIVLPPVPCNGDRSRGRVMSSASSWVRLFSRTKRGTDGGGRDQQAAQNRRHACR
jgi:hypothetical protein